MSVKKQEFDFVGKRNIAGVFSVIMVTVSLLLFFVRGPTWGIDFTGGTEIQFQFSEATTISELREAIRDQGLSDDSVQQVGDLSENTFVVRIQDPEFGTEDIKQNVTSALEGTFGTDWIAEEFFDAQVGARMMIRYSGDAVATEKIIDALSSIKGATVQDAPDDNTFYIKLPGLSIKIADSLKNSITKKFTILQADSVGPKVGSELKEQGIVSILSTLGLILVYVAFRFNISFAPGAVLALFHDVTVVVGCFIIFDMLGWTHEFNLPMVGALLTIIGYSLNDTIVIYDRIRENMTRYRRTDLDNLINSSINETLRRTIATSVTTMVAMLAFLFLGGPVIQTFALAIFLGVIFGTYSTVFVASPTILVMQDLRPKMEKFFTPLAEDEVQEEDTNVVSNAEKRRMKEREKST
jgi:preprotein translocase subunit SecF